MSVDITTKCARAIIFDRHNMLKVGTLKQEISLSVFVKSFL
jgi:hypothetical protein